MHLSCNRMGTSKRSALNYASNAPGPGAYQPPAKLGEGPKYGMRPKTAVIMRREVPGPGQYNPARESVNSRPPSAVMGKGSRGQGFGAAKAVPGPGAYSHAAEIKGGPAFSFGTSSGVKAHGVDVPGPGSYKLPSTISNLPTYAMPQKSKEFTQV